MFSRTATGTPKLLLIEVDNYDDRRSALLDLMFAAIPADRDHSRPLADRG